MEKVIETNLSMKNGNIVDFQSRVIEVKSWTDYVEEICNGDTVIRNSWIGNLHGNSIPQGARVENLYVDDFHLSCDVCEYNGNKSKKMAYLIDDYNEIKFNNGSTIKYKKCDDVIRGNGFNRTIDIFKREYESHFIEESDSK